MLAPLDAVPSPTLLPAGLAPLSPSSSVSDVADDARALSDCVTTTTAPLATEAPPRPTEGVVTVVPAQPSRPVPDGPVEFQTFKCNMELNGFSVYYVPHGLVRPLLRIATERVRSHHACARGGCCVDGSR